jgi:hypothetical protein
MAMLSPRAPRDVMGELILPLTALLVTAVVGFVCLKLIRRP